MSKLFRLADKQSRRRRPLFSKSHGMLREDDRRALDRIVHVKRYGLRWRDTLNVYGTHRTLYNRSRRPDEASAFTRMLEGLAAIGAEPTSVMIDATYLKAHRTASSLPVKRGASAA